MRFYLAIAGARQPPRTDCLSKAALTDLQHRLLLCGDFGLLARTVRTSLEYEVVLLVGNVLLPAGHWRVLHASPAYIIIADGAAVASSAGDEITGAPITRECIQLRTTCATAEPPHFDPAGAILGIAVAVVYVFVRLEFRIVEPAVYCNRPQVTKR